MKKYDVIVLGGNGFLGSEFVKFLTNKKLKVLSLNSKNYKLFKGSFAKLIINANGNTFRYKANKNPKWDFKKSFLSVCKSVHDFKYNFYIFISSVDVYDNKNDKKNNTEESYIKNLNLDFYAFHKWIAERYIEKYTKNYLIFRLGTLIGPNMKKGPFHDVIKNNSLYMSLDSKLTIISKSSAVNLIFKIFKLKKKNQIFNITSSNSFLLKNLKNKFKRIKVLANKKYDYNINVNKIQKYSKIPNSIDEVKNLFKSKN
jgi:nucleoside-diphosphate-sugar epimerase